ncbi:MAG: DUF4301 family protein [Bacteroidales bacterium]|nr:DUF4301 family protein [Bacteroidales bacterium]
MFTEQDKLLFKQKGISQEIIEKQLQIFKNGIPYPEITASATVGNGILKLNKEAEDKFISFYDNFMCKNKVQKFVPASGAASRMFKDLFAFLNDENATIADEKYGAVKRFFDNIRKFAFYNDLETIVSEEKLSMVGLLQQQDYKTILDFFLTDKGLNYGQLPKGVLAFHQYGDDYRTALEEHLVEGAHYANKNGETNIHFTVSPAHKELFEQVVSNAIGMLSATFQTRFNINYSTQLSATDTIAVDKDNRPFRNADGSLLFRPGGHGALIYNLNELPGDLIFIKNIDNVVPDHLKGETIRYKMLLAGILTKFRLKLHTFMDLLDSDIDDSLLVDDLEKMLLEHHIFDKLPEVPKDEKRTFYLSYLDKPIRVCGMVKNEGEPGGGPYWVKSKNGDFSSLQILESSQINMVDQIQRAIMLQATHFNPVDLVCWLRDYNNRRFDLTEFVDEDTYFISEKSKDGKKLKALELPGLWNGGMENWLTIFVEVPIITFNPVKTINDLLRKQHQNE